MKHLQLFTAALMAIAIVGCGGNSSRPINPPGVNLSEPRIEAVVNIEQTNLKNPGQYTLDQLRDPSVVKPSDLIDPTVYGIQDTLNFQAGEKFIFQLVSYTPTGQRVILDDAMFTTDDREFTYGTLANSGLFTASELASSSPINVYADYRGRRYFSQYQVRERQVRLIGSVLQESAGNPAFSGALVQFYDEVGRLVGSVRSSSTGSFRASLPISAVFFTVNGNSIPGNTHYRQFVFETFRYTADSADCRAILPVLETGTQTLDSAIYLTPRATYPDGAPEADGCIVNP